MDEVRRDVRRLRQPADQVRCSSGFTHAPGGRLRYLGVDARGVGSTAAVSLVAPRVEAVVEPRQPRRSAVRRTLPNGRIIVLPGQEAAMLDKLRRAGGEPVPATNLHPNVHVARSKVSKLRGYGYAIGNVPGVGYILKASS